MELSSLQKGLVGHWKLSESSFNPATKRFTDSSPYSNHGTGSGTQLGGSPTFQADHMGQSNMSTPFNGSDDYIRIPDSVSLSPTSKISVFCWVKGSASAQSTILSKYDTGIDQRSYSMWVSTDKLRSIISDDGTYTNIKDYRSSIVAFDNTWHFVGFTFNAGTLKLFVDGIEDTNLTKTTDDTITTIHNSTADATIGCYLNSNAPTSFFDGDLATPRIWDRNLSADEITFLYKSYNPGVLI